MSKITVQLIYVYKSGCCFTFWGGGVRYSLKLLARFALGFLKDYPHFTNIAQYSY